LPAVHALPFNAIALPVETLFPDIVKLRRFRREGCDSRPGGVFLIFGGDRVVHHVSLRLPISNL
jgi:hypothetical protein